MKEAETSKSGDGDEKKDVIEKTTRTVAAGRKRDAAPRLEFWRSSGGLEEAEKQRREHAAARREQTKMTLKSS